jgi:hypothetical protein
MGEVGSWFWICAVSKVRKVEKSPSRDVLALVDAVVVTPVLDVLVIGLVFVVAVDETV